MKQCFLRNLKDQNSQFIKITALGEKLNFWKIVADNL